MYGLPVEPCLECLNACLFWTWPDKPLFYFILAIPSLYWVPFGLTAFGANRKILIINFLCCRPRGLSLWRRSKKTKFSFLKVLKSYSKVLPRVRKLNKNIDKKCVEWIFGQNCKIIGKYDLKLVKVERTKIFEIGTNQSSLVKQHSSIDNGDVCWTQFLLETYQPTFTVKKSPK